MVNREYVHEATGFDNGDLFQSEAKVREYFTVANIMDMFGECPYTHDELDEMANAVIENRWHMALPVDEYRSVYNDGRGIPIEDAEPCPTCRGRGRRSYRWTVYRGGWINCPDCKGTGLKPKNA